MAYSSAELSADEIAFALADKPLLGALVGIGAISDAQWSLGDDSATAAGGGFGDADNTDTDYPATRACDGFLDYDTRPDTAGTSHCLCFDFGAAGVDIDGIAYVNHNWDTLVVTSCKLQIADDDYFTVNLITLSTINPSTLLSADTRFGDLILETGGGVARRYSTVQYARIVLVTAGATKPQVGEVLFIRRRQLPYKPNTPFDEDNRESSAQVYRTPKGVITKYAEYGDQKNVEAEWLFNEERERTALRGWWVDSSKGRNPFVWIYDPNASPDVFHVVVTPENQPRLRLPKVGPFEFTFSLNASEQGPENHYQAVEG